MSGTKTRASVSRHVALGRALHRLGPVLATANSDACARKPVQIKAFVFDAPVAAVFRA